MKWLRMVFGVSFMLAMLIVGAAVQSFAAFDYTNTFNGVQAELTTALTAIVPLVIVVFALVLSIRLAFRFFRSFSR